MLALGIPLAVDVELNDVFATPEAYWMEYATACAHGGEQALYVADEAQACVGMGHVRLDHGEARLGMLFVEDTHRRRGIGSALFVAQERWARDSDATHLVCHIRIRVPLSGSPRDSAGGGPRRSSWPRTGSSSAGGSRRSGSRTRPAGRTGGGAPVTSASTIRDAVEKPWTLAHPDVLVRRLELSRRVSTWTQARARRAPTSPRAVASPSLWPPSRPAPPAAPFRRGTRRASRRVAWRKGGRWRPQD